MPGRTPSPSEVDDAFYALNALLDSWLLERLLVYEIGRNVQTLNAGQQTYAIGTGAADFNVARPLRIEKAGLIYQGNPSQPLELGIQILTVEAWGNIPVKNIQSPIPLSLWYDAQFPVGQVNFWPIPSVTQQVALYLWNQIGQFTDITTPLNLPPGYLRALQYNLAVELAVRFPRTQMNPAVAQIAMDAKAKIKAINTPFLDMSCDIALLGRSGVWDYRTGDYVGGRFS
jgi:hypothetical protein